MRFGSVIGQTLDGKYKIEKQLGKGGMGTVYLATHIGTERPVAVKVIASEFMKRAEFVERFRREARAAGRLRHPNVVDVTDFGFSETSFGEAAYLVMEYLDGCTLGEILAEEKQLPIAWTVDILEQVCSAVHEAHREGIIHRDLKPDNIWLEPNQRGGYTVKVLDFGIAKLEEHEAFLADEAEGRLLAEEQPDAIDENRTIPDGRQTRTFFDDRNRTVAADEKTVIQNKENVSNRRTVAIAGGGAADQTAASEAGTIIQADDADEKDGTVFSPDGKTGIMSADDDAATKLISDAIETDKSGKIPPKTTGRSLLEAQSTAELTRVGAVLGTPLYMSPEQCRGEKLSPHSDIYSLGVIVYQMLSGKTPFDGDYTDVMEAHKTAEPPPLDAKKIPKRVKKVIQSALAKNPEERPPTAEGLASELRSSSEGLGTLLQRAMVIYSERLPKFLQIAFLLAIPSIILTIAGVALRFLIAAEILSDGLGTGILSGLLMLVTFFVQISYAALLVGMTTWIVAQVLAAPLRPINLKAAFGQAKLRLKPLLLTVTASTLLSFLSWIVGAIAGALVAGIFAIPVYYFTERTGLTIVLVSGFAFLGAVIIGVLISSTFMLIAPSIMMEGVRGRAAFRRSIELVKRSFRTVLATAVLVYIFPVVLAMAMGLAIGGIINAFSPKPVVEKPPAVAGQTETAGQPGDAENTEETDPKERNVGLSFGKKGFVFNTDNGVEGEKDKSMAGNFRLALQQGLFELLWSPLVILLSSFTSVLTALLYFKTRQAGGESMQGLLQQFEEAECSTSKWRKRVSQRLLQSGRSTGGKKITAG